ncbi:MAG: TonB-dependent receptor [Bacteroidota bacterium]|nr:TonB-dependent receptor [Bacteroidota bacterium]
MIIKKLLFLFILLFVVVSISFAQTTGKINGKIIDKESREVLIGVNVMLEGTTLGTVTDVDGNYVMLNVPVGTYNLIVRYVGYREVTVKNLKSMVSFTTTQNIEMSSEAVELKEVVISAERPIIPKDQTGTVRVVTSEQIQLMPVRGIREMAATTAGVVQGERGGELNIRGGRSEETGYIVDGVWTNNPLTGGSTAFVSQRAIQEMIVMTGGYSAEYGNVMSGIVNVSTKSGKPNYFGSFEYVTDGFLGDGVQGWRNNGYQLYNLAFGGPVIPSNKNILQFFGSFEYTFNRDPNPSFNSERLSDLSNSIWPKFKEVTVNYIQEGLQRLPKLPSEEIDKRAKELLLDQPNWNLARPGQMPDGASLRLAWNEKLTANLGDFRINLGGISSRTWARSRVFSYTLMNAFHNPMTNSVNDQYTLRVTWAPQPKTFAEVQGSYFYTYSDYMDPVHENRVFDYGDPAKNPLFFNYFPPGVDPSQLRASRIPMDIYLGMFAYPGRVYNGYGFNKTTFWQFNANVTHQLGEHEIKLGGEYKIHQLRAYAIGPLSLALLRPGIIDTLRNGLYDQLTEAQKSYVLKEYASRGINTYGYDYFGREVDYDGYNKSERSEGPKEPVFAALYLQDKMEYQDFIVNAGLRFDYWDSNTDVLKDLYDVANSKNTTQYGSPENFKRLFPNKSVPADGWGNPNKIEDDSFEESKPFLIFSPRLGFSFPVSERMVFFAQYGTFAQMPPLSNLYMSSDRLREWYLAPGYFSINNPRLRPQKTTQYELGIRQQLGEVASLNVTAYYKEITGLIQLGVIESRWNNTTFSTLQNGDYSTVRGFDLSFDSRRWNNLAASVNYTLSYATGTGSDPGTLGTILWLNARAPKFESPLDFDQRHTIAATLDYRFGKMDNVFLNQLGMNLLFRSNSGRPYTLNDPSIPPTDSRIKPQSTINANYSDWNFRFDYRIDKTFELPVSNMRLNTYILILNLLDRKNIASVWPGSGQPDQTGYTQTPDFKATIQRMIEQDRADEVPVFTGIYNMYEMQPGYVGAPRQVRFGLILEF